MKINRLTSTLDISLIALSIPATAFAWGKTGHRVGGEIAQDYLSADTKDAITSILGF